MRKMAMIAAVGLVVAGCERGDIAAQPAASTQAPTTAPLEVGTTVLIFSSVDDSVLGESWPGRDRLASLVVGTRAIYLGEARPRVAKIRPIEGEYREKVWEVPRREIRVAPK